MLVVCIDNKGFEKDLTKGRIYEAFEIVNNIRYTSLYAIITDNNTILSLNKSRFVVHKPFPDTNDNEDYKPTKFKLTNRFIVWATIQENCKYMEQIANITLKCNMKNQPCTIDNCSLMNNVDELIKEG